VALGVGLLWWQQERIVFQPPRGRDDGDGTWGADVERVTYRAEDGQPLSGFVVRPAAGTAAGTANGTELLIAFHGNAELASWSLPWAREVVRRTGSSVFLPEYRGYAGLPGPPTYEGSRHDAWAAYRFAIDRLGVAPERVSLFGHSLGTAIATEVAARARPRTLVLQAPFTSARAMARIFMSPHADRWWTRISRVHFDTEARVAALDCPVWVAHGDRDLVIPVGMGRQVHAAARVQGELLLVGRAGHNDVPIVAGEHYWEWLERALE
jgi:pimeloyl-ACP methyl ester carboxylesterase